MMRPSSAPLWRLVLMPLVGGLAGMFFATLLGRPDLGLLAVAWWTIIACAIHAVRLAQAMWAHARGRRITSWLADA